jgi:hypothetical protein
MNCTYADYGEEQLEASQFRVLEAVSSSRLVQQ